MKIWPGQPSSLGAARDGARAKCVLFSEHAAALGLYLFDGVDKTREIQRIRLPAQAAYVWHGYLPEVCPGQLYGRRVHSPYTPHARQRFNPTPLLLDSYAKAINGFIYWTDALFGYPPGHVEAGLSYDERDSATGLPKCVVIDPAFSWGNDTPPRTSWHRKEVRPHKNHLYEHLATRSSVATRGRSPCVLQPGLGRRSQQPHFSFSLTERWCLWRLLPGLRH